MCDALDIEDGLWLLIIACEDGVGEGLAELIESANAVPLPARAAIKTKRAKRIT